MKLLATLFLLIANVRTIVASGQSLRGSEEHADAIFCHLFVAMGSLADPASKEQLIQHQCMFDEASNSRHMHNIVLPKSFMVEHQRLIHQTPILKIPGGQAIDGFVVVPDFSAVTVHAETSPRRQLAPTSGKPSVLAVHVTTRSGESPRDSVDAIRGRVFGKGSLAQSNTVLTQYDKCSFGKQQLQPATEGSGVVDGVSQVQVDFSIGGNSPCDILGSCATEIERQTEIQLGEQLTNYDFVMFCVPDGSRFGSNGSTNWAAFAYIGSRTAYFQRGFCSVMTTNQHELGHLMGFGHSNEGNGVREDKSGAMGKSIFQYGGPNYCLNGHKYAQSGWMDEKKEVVRLTSGQPGYTGRLVAFVDFENSFSSSDRTLIEIDSGRSSIENAFAVYNMKKGFNDGVREKGNLVTVVQQEINSGTVESELVDGLDAGEVTTIPETSIIFKVCDKGKDGSIDFAKISIYDTSLGQTSTCDSPQSNTSNTNNGSTTSSSPSSSSPITSSNNSNESSSNNSRPATTTTASSSTSNNSIVVQNSGSSNTNNNIIVSNNDGFLIDRPSTTTTIVPSSTGISSSNGIPSSSTNNISSNNSNVVVSNSNGSGSLINRPSTSTTNSNRPTISSSTSNTSNNSDAVVSNSSGSGSLINRPSTSTTNSNTPIISSSNTNNNGSTATISPTTSTETCPRLQTGSRCRRDSNCCSGRCAGSGFSGTCA